MLSGLFGFSEGGGCTGEWRWRGVQEEGRCVWGEGRGDMECMYMYVRGKGNEAVHRGLH